MSTERNFGDLSKEQIGISVREVVVAEPHGPCGGVNAAIKFTHQLLDRVANREKVYTFNPVVHNHRVNADFEKKGLKLIEDRDESGDWDWSKVPDNSLVLLSAHGAKPSDTEIAEAKGCIVFDTTCVLVENEHSEVKKAVGDGRHVLLFGKSGHPEPRGTLAQVLPEFITLVSNEDDLRSMEVKPGVHYEFANQTTQSQRDISKLKLLAEDLIELIHVNPNRGGCYATDNRQNAVEDLVLKAREMAGGLNAHAALIVGSGDISNNTANMARIPEEEGVQVRIINGMNEIPWQMFAADSGKTRLLISSGASVPEEHLEEVLAEFEKRGARITYQVPIVVEKETTFPLKATKKLFLLEERYTNWSAPQA